VTALEYDPRHLAAVLLFNDGDYFEAHEVWEDTWAEAHGDLRRFYQGLIQAAVGLCHFGNGNLGGAAKLYRSSRDYHAGLCPAFLGMDLATFWRQMEACFAPVLGPSPPDRAARPDPALVPAISLDPPPEQWPDPEDYVHDEDE
jgi:hypothetical protein